MKPYSGDGKIKGKITQRLSSSGGSLFFFPLLLLIVLQRRKDSYVHWYFYELCSQKSQGKASAVETLKENGKTLKENLKNSKEKGVLSIVHRVLTIKKKLCKEFISLPTLPRSDLDVRLREDRRRNGVFVKLSNCQFVIKAIFTPLPRNGINGSIKYI